MIENIESLVLEHLRAIRTDIGDLKNDLRDVKQRLTCIDLSVIELRRDDVHKHQDIARQQVGLDQLVERVQRIERRLDLS